MSFVYPTYPAICFSLPEIPFLSASLLGGLLSKAPHKEGSRGMWMYSMGVLQMHQVQSDLNCVPGENTFQCTELEATATFPE